MVIGGGFQKKVGASTSVDLWLTTLHFGGELEAGVNAAFGFKVGANLKASACAGDCFDAINLGFSTCDIPALRPSGVKLFTESKRCDPALRSGPTTGIGKGNKPSALS